MPVNKCVFLDRDGVLNEEINDYVYSLDKLIIPKGMPEAIAMLKQAGYLLVVVTNQAGIAKGLYRKQEVQACHQKIQEACGHLIDALYYCPYHPKFDSESLLRKPGSLMLEKAAARFNIDITLSWMVGDRQRDIEAGQKVGAGTVFIEGAGTGETHTADYVAKDLWEAAQLIVSKQKR
ncbi:HAD family hydrolase [Rhodocytophaga rosea]|uniref:D,D-heptose 1,7-bisphosphate phosphatase n=1 Tax=Rhodocytophaga rosea TaxID=2704465 RepID=A0A6C0GNJ7_9BACT|nr:HAD family hydrolase [Rhodocytophaga rosea]QHT69203.1 HAD family hydrolase [Rhodocytophaga rosea]